MTRLRKGSIIGVERVGGKDMQRLWKFRVYVGVEEYGKDFEVWSSVGNYGKMRSAYKWIRFMDLGETYVNWVSGLLTDFLDGKDKSRNGVEYIKDCKFNPNFRNGDGEIWVDIDKIKSVYFTIHNEFRLRDFGKSIIKRKLCKIGGDLDEETRQEILDKKNKLLYG